MTSASVRFQLIRSVSSTYMSPPPTRHHRRAATIIASQKIRRSWLPSPG